MCEIANYAGLLVILAPLGKGDVQDGCRASKFWNMHRECCGPNGGTTKEAEMQGNGVWLILGGEGGAEVDVCYSKDTGCYVATLWNCIRGFFRLLVMQIEGLSVLPNPIDQPSGKTAE